MNEAFPFSVRLMFILPDTGSDQEEKKEAIE